MDNKRTWLKALRSELGMTGREVAKEVGISHNYLFEIENGLRTPSGKLACKLAAFYGIDMALFYQQPKELVTAK